MKPSTAASLSRNSKPETLTPEPQHASRLEDEASRVLANNSKTLLELESRIPYLKGRLYKKEIKDDAEYITFPLMGGMIVQKQTLNVAQVCHI
jgi:hypothetical protein